jgi:hypothetical protein
LKRVKKISLPLLLKKNGSFNFFSFEVSSQTRLSFFDVNQASKQIYKKEKEKYFL